jgi:hypothetical protein
MSGPGRRTERKSASRGHSMIIDIFDIAGTVFGLLVTLGLLVVYVDDHRSDRHRRRNLDDQGVLSRRVTEMPN